MYLILSGLLAGAVICLLDIFFFLKEKKAASIVHIVFRDVIFTNLLTLAVSKYVFHVANVFAPSLHQPIYPLKYFALAVVLGLVWLFIDGILRGVLTFESDAPKKKGGAWTMRIIAAVLFALGVAAFTGTEFGLEAFNGISPDEMLITLISPITGTGSDVMALAIEGPFLKTAFWTAVFCLIVFPNRKIVYRGKKAVTLVNGFARRLVALILSVLLLVGGVAFGYQKLQLDKLRLAYTEDSPLVEENYVNPREVKMQFPEKKRNLIHIYLESVENSYLSKELGGYMSENLMPELTELSKEGVNFSHLPDRSQFGGPTTMYGCTWSVASMVNQGFGIPMKVPMDGNSYGTPGNFMPGAVSMGDILKQQGYVQEVMFGADADFGGLTYYYQTHGDFKIFDYKYAKDEGFIPKDYYEWWGFEDDKLYEFAKQEITRLYETGKPFNFTMENADTHFPDGYLSPGVENKYDQQYANVIAYSTAQVVDFVRWIQAQPFYENTTIVLIGDHPSMDKNFFQDFDASYQRTTFNLILNPAPSVANTPVERTYNRVWNNFDFLPTILSALGVKIEGERLALGTNLFSNEPTLCERVGYGIVYDEFVKRSSFYNENFLLGKYKEFEGDNVTTY